jgi:class 3 adenylate cyclase
VSAEPIRYARSGDVNIAYQVTGDGPFDLVYVPGFFSHLEIDWEHPGYARCLERLGSFARMIRFDKRGTGLSDRGVGLPDVETRIDDVRAVMDAVGCGQAALFGYSEGGPLCIVFAATYPTRVRALALYGTYAKRCDPDDDYPWAPTWEQRLAHARELEETWGENVDHRSMAPSADPATIAWIRRRGRAGLSPAGVRDLILMNARTDVRDLLPSVQCPTLVLHRTGDLELSVDEGRYIASRIPGARFVELTGSDHSLSIDPDQVVDEIEEFLTGVRPAPPTNRVLATLLFTDLVGSTEKADVLGDAAWSSLLASHNDAVRRELARFSGEEIDTAGDGFLASFDGPARAIRCGLAIREALRPLGLDVRAGVHTGEVERRVGDKPRGIAVHVGARVMSLADAGEVLVSSTTRDLVAGSGLEFDDRGERELKGIEGPRRIFAAKDEASLAPTRES